MCPRTTLASQRPRSGMGWRVRRLSWSLTAFSLARIRFGIVIRFGQNRPFPDFAQICVKPRLWRRRHNLGFNIRGYRNGKLLIKPSKAAIRRVKQKLAEQMRRLRAENASAVLAAICPITRGWASYYPSVVSKKTFTAVDDYL